MCDTVSSRGACCLRSVFAKLETVETILLHQPVVAVHAGSPIHRRRPISECEQSFRSGFFPHFFVSSDCELDIISTAGVFRAPSFGAAYHLSTQFTGSRTCVTDRASSVCHSRLWLVILFFFFKPHNPPKTGRLSASLNVLLVGEIEELTGEKGILFTADREEPGFRRVPHREGRLDNKTRYMHI